MNGPSGSLRELVQRLIIAEILARPGEGPLARRPSFVRGPRRDAPHPTSAATDAESASGDEEPRP